MKIRYMEIILIASLLQTFNVYGQSIESANSVFDNANYNNAMESYLALAEEGDKFAQYRLALMNYFGLGVDKDIEQAYAWMAVAAEEEITILRKFQLLIWDEMDAGQRERATEMATINEKNYGTEVTDSTRSRQNRTKQDGRCTGSRLGSNCDRVVTFGVDLINRDDLSPASVPYSMTVKEAQEFNDQYKNRVLSDFEKYDQG